MQQIKTNQVTDLLLQKITTLAGEQDQIFIGLSGGRSLDTSYPHLIAGLESLPSTSREKIRFCFVDERVLVLDDPESNYGAVYQKFFAPLLEKNLISAEQIISIDPEHPQPAQDYNEKVPQIDIALFGVGEDGHIASLFPEHALLSEPALEFLEILDSPKAPPHRITISTAMISQMALAIVFFIGAGKADAYQDFIDPEKVAAQLPAKLVQLAQESYAVVEL